MSAQCSSCGAPIIWAKTATGKAIPLDAKPEKRLVLFDHDQDGRPILAAIINPAKPLGNNVVALVHETFQTHFVSCPNAAKHRKR